MFNFDYSFLSLPKKFYSLTKPSLYKNSDMFISNDDLFNELNLPINRKDELLKEVLSKKNHKQSYAQAYSGHQFGYFTKLGDGRAIIIGEHITSNKQRFDIQLKGGGRTIYSRNGDGKATLSSMLREYIISEAMHYLNIPTSRSLAIIKTNEQIFRENIHEGGVLVRVMKSHIRVGTFENAYYYGSINDLKALTKYTINRLFPEIKNNENPPLDLLNKVMNKQIDLVVNWMRVGFIHGVMNTDNTSLTGDSFDYGPCAFINTYNPYQTYSSIDHNNRYAFGNQKNILKWNLSRFAESLLPVIHENKEKAIKLAQNSIDKFSDIWEKKYYGMMLKKIGIGNNHKALFPLVDELLENMMKMNLDYTNTFTELNNDITQDKKITNNLDFIQWHKKWKKNINKFSSINEGRNLMRKNNPIFIPRNNLVEEAIEKAVDGNQNILQKLLQVTSNPYKYQNDMDEFMKPPEKHVDECYQTYCGT